MAAERDDKLDGYPNLQAILDGRVSGHYTEWPMVRVELRSLLAAQSAVARIDPGTEKMLRTLLDRAYKMMLQSGYRVAEVNPDHNDPIIAWMSDARAVLYGSGRQPDLGSLT